MSEHAPVSVFVAPDAKVAELIATWFRDKGIDTRFEVASATGEPGSPDRPGVHVLVTDPARAEEARQLIAERAAEAEAIRAKLAAREARTGTVTAVCEECGHESVWSAAEMGTTQDCPNCENYMDVPDPDDDWDGVDFGSEDEPEAEQEA